MSAHTPGPWTVRTGREGDGSAGSAEVQICNDEGRAVAIVIGDGSDEWKANVDWMVRSVDSKEQLGHHLIEVWVANYGQIPWAKALQILAIVGSMSEADQVRLLTLDGEDPRVERLLEALRGMVELAGRLDSKRVQPSLAPATQVARAAIAKATGAAT